MENQTTGLLKLPTHSVCHPDMLVTTGWAQPIMEAILAKGISQVLLK